MSRLSNKKAVYNALEAVRLASRRGQNAALTPDKKQLHAEEVVEAAKDQTSPLHRHFTWDDTKAAHQYRLEQARELIRVTYTITTIAREPIHAYVSISTDRYKGGGYRTIGAVLANKRLTEQLLKDLLNDLQIIEQKYKTIAEAARLFKGKAWQSVVSQATKVATKKVARKRVRAVSVKPAAAKATARQSA